MKDNDKPSGSGPPADDAEIVDAEIEDAEIEDTEIVEDAEIEDAEIEDAEIVEDDAGTDDVNVNGGVNGGVKVGTGGADADRAETAEAEAETAEAVDAEAVDAEVLEPELVETESGPATAGAAAAAPSTVPSTGPSAGPSIEPPAPYRLSARPRSAVRSAIWLSVLAVLLLLLVGAFVVPVLVYGSEPVLPTVIAILAAGAVAITFGRVVPRLLRPMLLAITADGIAVRASGGALAAARWEAVQTVEVMTGLIPTRSGEEAATPVLVVWTRAGEPPPAQNRVDAALLAAIDGGPDSGLDATGPQPAAAIPLAPFDAPPEDIITGVRTHAPAGVPVRDRRIDS